MKYCKQLWVAVLAGVMTLNTGAQPAAVVQRHVAIAPAQVFPAKEMLTNEELGYFQLGELAAQRNIHVHLGEFETRIRAVYTGLAGALAPHRTTEQRLGLVDSLVMEVRVKIAERALRQAQLALLESVGMEREAQPILAAGYFHFRKAFSVYSPRSFQMFLDGIYKATGRYIQVRSEVRQYGSVGQPIQVRFPSFCFYSPSVENIVAVPAAIRTFLASSPSHFDASRLYDIGVTAVRESAVKEI